MRCFVLVPLIIGLTSCTRLPPVNDQCISVTVADRTSADVSWMQSCEENPAPELTIDSAVQFALHNNPDVQTAFENLGIAHADLVNAGLFRNPIFDAFFRFPDRNSLSLNTEFSITQAFLDILEVPLRTKVAYAELEKVKLTIAHQLLDIVFDVQITHTLLVYAVAKAHLLNAIADIADIAAKLSDAQIAAGNIDPLEYQDRYNESLQAMADVADIEVEIGRLREVMNRLLGLTSPNPCWTIPSDFPPRPTEELSSCTLQEIAIAQRLDIEAARWEIEKMARMHGAQPWWVYLNLAGGFAGEKDTDGTWTQGPAFLGAIPIFNCGQADRARLRAQYRQSIDRLNALVVSALSEVRSAHTRLLVQRLLVSAYENDILPAQKLSVTTAQTFYNGMAFSVYELLKQKKQELCSEIGYLSAVKDYWVLRIDLDRALDAGTTQGDDDDA